MIAKISNIHAAVGGNCNASGLVQSRLGGGAAITVIAKSASAGHGRNNPIRAYAADAMIGRLGNTHAAVGANRNPLGSIKLRPGRGAAITAIAKNAITGHGVD